MLQRGRKPSLGIAASVDVSAIDRLPPNPILTDAEQAVWYEVINDLPADYFTPIHRSLLEMYCRHVVQANLIADKINEIDLNRLEDYGMLTRYDKLLQMQQRETSSASAIATRLRLTKQSVDAKTAARQVAGKKPNAKPWEINAPQD